MRLTACIAAISALLALSQMALPAEGGRLLLGSQSEREAEQLAAQEAQLADLVTAGTAAIRREADDSSGSHAGSELQQLADQEWERLHEVEKEGAPEVQIEQLQHSAERAQGKADRAAGKADKADQEAEAAAAAEKDGGDSQQEDGQSRREARKAEQEAEKAAADEAAVASSDDGNASGDSQNNDGDSGGDSNASVDTADDDPRRPGGGGPIWGKYAGKGSKGVDGFAYATYHYYAPGYETSSLYCADQFDKFLPISSDHWLLELPWTAYCNDKSLGPMSQDKCGKCLKATNPATGQSVKLRVVDKCGQGGVDIDPLGFNAIDGNGAGVRDGHMNLHLEWC